MVWFDVFRYAIFAAFGIGLGFMFMTNTIAFIVLRPPHKLGFLWWHVTSISLSFLALGTVAVERVTGQLGQPLTWRSFAALFGTLLFAIAQVIIFGVERQRLVSRRGLDTALAQAAYTDPHVL